MDSDLSQSPLTRPPRHGGRTHDIRRGPARYLHASHETAPGLGNGCFSRRWTERQWRRTLERYVDTPGYLFAVVPDVVADAAATDELWTKWAPVVRDYGYRPAYVLQNGCRRVPSDAAAIFTGGRPG